MAVINIHNDFNGEQTTLNMSDADLHSILSAANRYYMGRHTIATHGFCKYIIASAKHIPTKTRFILWRDAKRWLKDHPTHMFGGCDDAEPFRNMVKTLEDIDPEIRNSQEYIELN